MGGSWGAGDLQLKPTHFDWHRGEQIGDIVVITETSFDMVDSCKEKIKILLILECPSINPDIYKKITQPKYYSKFDYILTHSKVLQEINREKFVPYIFGGCWIYENDRKIYNKSKDVSIIASLKRETEGHKLRHEAIEKYGSSIDGVYGNGYKFVQNKIEALADYRYSIVIENDNTSGGGWATEKIIDCFMTGTIPIYWGTSDIGDYFNRLGIIQFSNIDELGLALNIATPEFYESRLDSIQDNFERGKQFCLPEDFIWESFLKDIYTLTTL
jgi:hypothetical protein